MIRAPLGDMQYWDKWGSHMIHVVQDNHVLLARPSQNPVYDPQFSLNLCRYHLELTLERYSRGDPIPTLANELPGILDAWELSNKLAEQVCIEHHVTSCRDWVFDLSNLNHYNWCFWLIGLALALDLPEDPWQRLLALVDGEGQDVLLDRIIATRQPGRKVGQTLLHPKPYARLLRTIDAPPEQQAQLLSKFVSHWYSELKRPAKQELWWYVYGDPEKHPLESGSYFGRWCIEAVAAVKAFRLDDRLCLGHEHYPGDLLRPAGPSTHPLRKESHGQARGWLARLIGQVTPG